MFLRGLSLLRSTSKVQHSARIMHVTDSEGSASFFSAVRNSQIVRLCPRQGLQFRSMPEMPYFIYGGDITDRGSHDLAITRLLVDFKNRYPWNVVLLAGNRDVNKIRVNTELASEYIRERLLHSQSPRWLPQQHTVPLDYAKSAMKAKNPPVETDARAIQDYVASLATVECQLVYLRWMLEKTMGSPHAFRYRREELARTAGKEAKDIADEAVLLSFMNESSPQGITGQYLQLAQIGVVIPGTGVLAIHGGLTPFNIGRLPGMKPDAQLISDPRRWIKKLNYWFNDQIKLWANAKPEYSTVPAGTALDEYALPLPGKPKPVMIADMLGKDRQFAPLPQEVTQYLNGINIVLTGHQPCGDHPAIVRDQKILFINGDTGYASNNRDNPDNTRGAAWHTLDIAASTHTADVRINATLSDNTDVQTKLTVTPGKVEGDSYIGLVTEDHRLVQCKLPNGDYRLIQQNGHQTNYSTLSSAEVERLFCRQTKAPRHP